MADKDSIFCPNCKQRTNLIHRADYPININYQYEICECNGCDFFFLVKRFRSDDRILEIWPKTLPESVDEKIPENIRQDFTEAYLCFSVGAYRACAVMARRALQNLCIEKGAKKDAKLEQQIDFLQSKGIITVELQNWAHEVRMVGNDGAHPNQHELVGESDARDILDLLKQFCQVMYIAPSIAAERKQARERASKGE